MNNEDDNCKGDHMLVTGIGHAIVDVICKVDDAFLVKNNLVKGTMTLVDKNEFTHFLSSLET